MTKCWRIVSCYGEPSEMKFALNVEQAATIIENIDTKTHEYMPAGQMEFILPYSNTQSNYLFIEELGAPMKYPSLSMHRIERNISSNDFIIFDINIFTLHL